MAKIPANRAKADARTRTGDPFITSERRVRDARPLAGTRGQVFPGDQAISRLCQWTGVSARARVERTRLVPGLVEQPSVTGR
jgi:hypothetical protein